MGTRARLESSPEQAEERLQKLAGAVKTIFECIGEDPERQGLRETPERYAKALMYFTKGYEENVRDLVNGAVFHEDHDELVIVKDIEVFSLCEHHMVPFTGKVAAIHLVLLFLTLTATTDAYRLHPQPPRSRPFQVRSPCRNVLATASGPRTSHETSCSCHCGSAQTTRRRGGHGVKSPMHGYAWRSENCFVDNDKLHARCHEVKRQDKGRIPELVE